MQSQFFPYEKRVQEPSLAPIYCFVLLARGYAVKPAKLAPLMFVDDLSKSESKEEHDTQVLNSMKHKLAHSTDSARPSVRPLGSSLVVLAAFLR